MLPNFSVSDGAVGKSEGTFGVCGGNARERGNERKHQRKGIIDGNQMQPNKWLCVPVPIVNG